MCAICSMGGFATAAQAATLFGGPLAYAGYRRARRALRLPDTSVAACEARAESVASRGADARDRSRQPGFGATRGVTLRVRRRIPPGAAHARPASTISA